MNNYFFIDTKNNVRLTYNELFQIVGSDGHYTSNYKTKSAYLFLINLLKALIRSNDVELLDYDFSDDEILKMTNKKHTEKNEAIAKIPNLNAALFLNLLQNSSSKITIYTSGTTGLPKQVIHSVQTLTKQVKINPKFDMNNWGFAYNPTHMAGLQVFFQALFNFNTIVNLFNGDKSYVLQEIENHSVTNISATPTFYRLLYPSENQLKTVERVTVGGEKSTPDLYQKMQTIFPNAVIRNVYASTEAGSVLSAKGNVFCIDEKNTNFAKIENDILYIHESVLGTSDSFTFENNWYNTGDIVKWIDYDQRTFTFVSRANEMINVGGYKINPNEVEDVIREYDEVRQVRVYGISNSVLGNMLTADIELNENAVLSEVDVKLKLKGALQSFKIPRKIHFVDTINYSRTGKISRS